MPARHWFRLGRAVTPVGDGAALISWSGSMFEYLMPSLVMRAPAGSLLEQTDRLVVRRQIEYGAQLGLPWGISESAYNARDLEFTYQYSNFGVPGLGLKRGLGENAVIAPYATALAAMVDPAAAVAQLRAAGGDRRARPLRLLRGAGLHADRACRRAKTFAIVRAFMAHHQGMTIVAIANALLDGVMRERFHAEPIIQATELLLQERVPRDVADRAALGGGGQVGAARRRCRIPRGGRKIASPHHATPATQLLSNGRYAVMLTAAGSGYSRWGDIAITRWREDATCDDCGSYIFLRDMRSGAVWSAGFQPTGAEPDDYARRSSTRTAPSSRGATATLTTTLEVLVSAEDDAEVRRRLDHQRGQPTARDRDHLLLPNSRWPAGADVAHPAFSKLFVETEYLADLGAILATRRKRTPTEPEIWAAHLSVADGEAVGEPEFETDRARFLGRGHGVSAPIAMLDARPLSELGRRRARSGLRPAPPRAHRARARRFASRSGRWRPRSRAALLDCVDKHRDAAAFERATTLAWTQAQVQLHHLGVRRRRGRAVPAPGRPCHLRRSRAAARRRTSSVRARARSPGSGPQGISGDLPIVLLRIADIEDLDVARQIAAGARILADEAARGRSRDPERARVVLCPGSADRARDPGARQPIAAGARSRAPAGPRLRAARRPDRGGDAVAADLGRRASCWSAQRGSLADQLDRAAGPSAADPAARQAAGAAAARAPAALAARRSSSSSTASADSATAARNM